MIQITFSFKPDKTGVILSHDNQYLSINPNLSYSLLPSILPSCLFTFQTPLLGSPSSSNKLGVIQSNQTNLYLDATPSHTPIPLILAYNHYYKPSPNQSFNAFQLRQTHEDILLHSIDGLPLHYSYENNIVTLSYSNRTFEETESYLRFKLL
jgi:hypothetical protein